MIVVQVLAVWLVYGVLTICIYNLFKWHVGRRSR